MAKESTITKSEQIEQEMARLLAAMQNLGNWSGSAAIRKAAGLELAGLYNIQRRLQQLEKRGKIEISGHGRGTRYRISSIENAASQFVVSEQAPVYTTSIVLSPEAQNINRLVTRTLSERTHVNYNRKWLELYRPNVDFFLSNAERKRLHEWGATPTNGQPAGTYAKQMMQRLLIDLSWNSSRLEGNTYSLLDTRQLLNDGEPAPGKDPAEAQMILNHKDAIEFLVENAGETGLNPYTIRNLHAMLAYNLLADPSAPGRIRQFAVGIGKSVYTPLQAEALIEEMFRMILDKASAIIDPFEQAFFVMVHIPYLQPFEDVNKRVSRLAANIPLNRHNLIPLSFIDVPKDLYIHGLLGVYEHNSVVLLKEVFLWAYQRSVRNYAAVQQTLGEPDLFRMQYAGTIRSLITHIIANNMSQQQAGELISQKAKELPENDRDRLTESVEKDLLGLHEGNFARYYIRPSAFNTWQEHWGLQKK